MGPRATRLSFSHRPGGQHRQASLRPVRCGKPPAAPDGLALGEVPRVAPGGDHHHHRRVVAPLELRPLEQPLARLEQHLHEVAPEANHERLALRVAEADVVLEELRAAAVHHEPGEEDADEGHPLLLQGRDGGLDHLAHHLCGV